MYISQFVKESQEREKECKLIKFCTIIKRMFENVKLLSNHINYIIPEYFSVGHYPITGRFNSWWYWP